MKLNKYLLIFLSILILFVFIAQASAADANSTDTLSTVDNNEILSIENDVSNYSELSREIGSGGQIELQHDYYTYDTGNTIEISVDNSFINGKGAVIDMAGSSIQAFMIAGKNVVINNLTIKNANAEYGSAITWFGANGAVFNCTFTDNNANDCGGAIRWIGDNGTVSNCIFTDNNANVSGGAIGWIGDNGTVNNCALVNNTAPTGSEIYIPSGNSNLNYNWWGSNNPNWNELFDSGDGKITAPSKYAVLAVSANPYDIFLTEESKIATKFVWNGTNNDATSLIPKRNVKLSSTGGHLTSTAGYVGLTSKFTADSPNTYTITATVDNQTLSTNVIVIKEPKTIYVNATAPLGGDGKTPDTAFKTLNEALNNATKLDTIMIASGEYKGTNNTGLNISKNLNFIKYGDSEVIFDAEGLSRIWTVTATSINITGLTFKNGKGDNDYAGGGAIYFSNLHTNSNINATFINNTAKNGGAIFIQDGGVSGNLNSIFINNSANFGGAIYIEEGDISGNINGTFVHNYAITGCAIYAEKGNVSGNLTGIFANNVDGGAIFINGDVSGNLDGIYINNTAWGGAVYISRNLSGNLNGTFINNTKGAVYIGRFLSGNLNGTFVNNQHAVYIMGGLYGNLTGSYINNTGGAVYIYYGGISGNLTGTFINNTSEDGGAIYINYGGVSGNLGGTFINNTAEDDGGAIYIFNGGISGNLNATFINNKANYYGGAINIWNDGISGNLTGFYINNTARYGGAISLDYDILGNVGGFYINNTADEGGAINIWDGSVLGNLSCSFINNKAKKGEAIYIDFDYDQNDYLTVIRDSIFINNNESTIYLRSFKIDIVICLENTTGNITVNSRDKTYNTTVVNGNATLTPPGLSVNVTSHSGDKKYTYTTVEIFVLQKSDVIIDAPDVIKYYGGPERFIAYLYDSKDNPIVNKSVNITINGVTYTRITDSDGIVSLALRLGNGTYYVTTTADDTTVKSMVTVLSTVIGYDITKYYKNATQYCVNVYDTYGDAVGKGEVVTFNVNGRFYNRTTDENGIATLNINLPQGEYVITAINPVTGEMHSNNINVLPVVAAKDITMKYMDGTQFVATLVDGQGKPYAEQFVTFNVNGIFYNRLTDSNGQAALNIRLPPGEYIITSSFNGCNIANKITVMGVL